MATRPPAGPAGSERPVDTSTDGSSLADPTSSPTSTPSKRRRLSHRHPPQTSHNPPMAIELPSMMEAPMARRPDTDPKSLFNNPSTTTADDRYLSSNFSASSRLAGQTVAPFLAKHIPLQYAPLGASAEPERPADGSSNTKYCYRHRPDSKCRRQADEPSMEQLQNVRITHPFITVSYVY